MTSQEFTVLYTHQKTKKAKVWQDGILKTSGGQQAVLYSDKGQSLDCVYVKTGMVSPGDELESDRYLITVEAVGNTNSSTKSSTDNKDAQNCVRLSQKPIGLRPPAGLKRKFMGFQGPREIAKKPSPEAEETATLSSLQLAHGCSSQSPQLYATSPLFASPYGKQTDKDKQVYCSSKQKIVTVTNPVGRENTFSSTFFASPNQPVTKVSGDRVIEVEKTNPRSTAQILALLNALPGQKEPVSDHLPAGVSTLSSNEIQKTTSMRNYLEDAKPCTIPSELSPVRAKPVKSRWEVYLDNPVDPSSTQIDHDDLILSPSPGKMLMHDKARPEEDRELHRKIDMEENNQLPYTHISKPGLPNSQSPTPKSLAAGTDYFIPDDENNDGAFSEITFNLMDSFDFTELDDADLTESPTETVSHSAKESTHLTEKQDFLQKKSQEKHGDNELTENTPLYKNWETTTVSELSHNKAESESTIQTLQNSQSEMDKTGDNDGKAEVMAETNVLQTVGKGGFLCPSKFPEGQIPSRHVMYELDDIAKQKALAKNPQEPLGSPSVLPSANMHHSVHGSNEDGNSSELWPSGNCISLLRSLTTPSNALESLNVFSSMTPTTTENIDNDSQTYLESSEKQAPHRLKKMPLADSEDHQKTPLFITEFPFSPVFTSLYNPPPVSPPLTSQPVEFQGYKVKGSASSAVVIRHHNPESCTKSPSRSQCTQSTSGFISSTTCIFGGIIPDSHNSTWKEAFFDANVFSESGSEQSFVTTMQNCPPKWTVGTSGSDCDWEISQWTPHKSDEVKTPTQNSSEKVRPFFLRPRQDNVDVNFAVQLHDSTASLEQNHFFNSTKISKVQTGLIKKLTAVPVPSYELEGSAFNIPQSVKPGQSVASPEMQSSKWTAYQSVSTESSQNVNKEDSEFCPESVFRSWNGADIILNNDTEPTALSHLDSLKDIFGNHNCNSNGSRSQILTKTITLSDRFLPLVGKKGLHSRDTGDEQVLLSCELGFPCRQTVLSSSVPKRKVNIPPFFKSPVHYKQVFSACLSEHLNIIMHDLSQRLHKAFSKADMSFYTSSADETHSKDNAAPFCQHQQQAKLVMVRKEGPNKGRFFYACDAPKASQCKFFKWLDEVKGTHAGRDKYESKVVIADMKSLSSYVRCQNIKLYEESQLIIRKMSTFPKREYGKFKKFASGDSEFGGEAKTKLYLKLSRKDSSSAYNKDDLWVVSKTLNFDPMDTFIACSVFYGPSSNNDIEISPLKGYSPSNWPSNMIVHALLVCNASTELTSLRNIQEHFNPISLPIMPHLLTMSTSKKPIQIPRGRFRPPAITAKASSKCNIADHTFVLNSAREMISQFCLNEDQATALLQIAHMMSSSEALQGRQSAPITIIHGVFGAGKSYLLAVVVLFLVQLFEVHNPPEECVLFHWKLLISSSTNVAVDRVLLGLLDLGFDQFIRVGSIRKIAKPILPHSLHAGSENESEQLKELQALLKEDLTPGEKAYVRKSIELHKLGTNKTLLRQVRVVGATCAACPFPCLSNLTFPVVILDECSQMTEPASLLPIARFHCEKLILVGDPKQLSPTIQGSEAAHEYGLEQTLLNRLCLMGHQAVRLRTQYRCHPTISAIANELFYEGSLLNGVSHEDRKPLLAWLPTLCFYNASGTEQVEGNSSFYNVEEANFTVKLIQSLIASGIQGSMIGVITLYRSQMNKICYMLSSAAVCDPLDMKAVQVSTVDAFQGAEKEIIILSCVRTRQVGFIDSEKRMNVALTRGKRHLLIVGSLACLRKNKLWEQVIHHCEKHKDGLKHVSQWDERLNAILALYQENKEKEASNTQKKQIKASAVKI